jgi:hypothetical protein
MKINFIKSILFLAIPAVIATSCVSDDDYAIPPVYEYLFNEGFSSSTTGSGTTEVAIDIEGWVNHNATGTRLWHARTFNSDNYAEFSSFYSASGVSDVAWLVTPAIDLTQTTGEKLSFTTKTRFQNGYPLTVFVSTDFDGTSTGIASATWTEVTFTAPTEDDEITGSGAIDLSGFDSDNVRIAFKYTGSKAGVTTTLQLDNIKITKD